MGILALLACWGLYRYTDLLANVPVTRALDWLAEKISPLISQPWARGLTAAVIVAALPAILIGLLMGLGAFISWPIGVAVVLLCMGPQRLFELPALGDLSDENHMHSSLTAERYHLLAVREPVAALFWAAVFGAPGAVFYRAARELAESPAPSLVGDLELNKNARLLFGFMHWLPARLYAIAQVATGSGGQLEKLFSINIDVESADTLVQTACGDKDAAVKNAPKALLLVVAVLSAAVFFI